MANPNNPGNIPVFSLDGCYMRFQQPANATNQAQMAARVTQTNWNQDAGMVASTINHYVNEAGTNLPLWVNGTSQGLSYAGFILGGSVDPQPGLNANNVVVSIILPSGVARLRMVSATITSSPPGPNEPPSVRDGTPNAQVANVVFGIALRDQNDPLVLGDYAYTTADRISTAVGDVRHRVVARANGGFVASTGAGPNCFLNISRSL